MTPYIPVTPEEIVEEIREGIWKYDTPVILCVSARGRTHSEFQRRSECLDLAGC